MKDVHTIATWGTGAAGLAGLVMLSLYSWPAVFAPSEAAAVVVLPADTADKPAPEPVPVDGGKPDSSVESASATVIDAGHPVLAEVRDVAKDVMEDGGDEGDLLDPVFFEPRRYDLSAEYEARMATIAAAMLERQRARLVITGFSAPRGGKRYNLYLAKQRARVIRDRLVEAGVPFKRMRAKAVVLSRRESRMSGDESHRAELSLVERPRYAN